MSEEQRTPDTESRLDQPSSPDGDSRTPSPRRGIGWPAAFAIVAVVGLLLVAGITVFLANRARDSARATLDAGRRGVEAVQELASAFHTGEITTTFASYTTRVRGSSHLQFATIDQLELFERAESGTAFWGQLELPRVVVEARAPVQYSYYLDLDGTWQFVLDGSRLTVQAPAIEYNRPSFNPSEIDYRVQEDSLWRDEAPVLEALRSGLGDMAQERAEENIELVREIGRRETAEFVENWLLSTFGPEAKDLRIDVYFADERMPELPEDALRSTTELTLPASGEAPGEAAREAPQ